MGHFDKTDGICSLCSSGVPGSLEHLLALCPALEPCRRKQFETLEKMSNTSKEIIIEASQDSVSNFVHILLDCSSAPNVIMAYQQYGYNILHEIFKFTRTWCYNIHVTRMKMIGRWKSNV